jgi:hypothetical protein
LSLLLGGQFFFAKSIFHGEDENNHANSVIWPQNKAISPQITIFVMLKAG